MLHSLPYQGIVLTLIPFLPSPHRCIKWSASIWRGYDLFFFANLVIHSTDKLLFTRKHQWWARSAWLPDKVMCNIPSLPSYSVVVSTHKSSPGRLDLFVKSLSLRSAGEYQPGPLATNWLCKSRHYGSRSPHMVLTSYFLLRSWKS